MWYAMWTGWKTTKACRLSRPMKRVRNPSCHSEEVVVATDEESAFARRT